MSKIHKTRSLHLGPAIGERLESELNPVIAEARTRSALEACDLHKARAHALVRQLHRFFSPSANRGGKGHLYPTK